MTINDLIQRAVSTLWTRKVLMLLGTLFVIVTSGVQLQDILVGPLLKPLWALFDLPPALLPPTPNDWPIQLLMWAEAHGTLGWSTLVIGSLLLGIALGVIAIVTRGALIALAGAPDYAAGLGTALKASWRKAWRLIIIASIPPIPVTIAAILLVVLATTVIQLAGGIDALSRSAQLQQQVGGGLLVASMVVVFPCAMITYALGLLSTLADRACVLEDRRVIESYQRGWAMLQANMGSAVLLALFHVIAGSVIGSALALPGLLAAFCFAIAPVLWIVLGIEKAFLVTLWTLAWQEWADTVPSDEPTFDQLNTSNRLTEYEQSTD